MTAIMKSARKVKTKKGRGVTKVERVVQKVKCIPNLEELSNEQLKQLAKSVGIDELKAEMANRIKVSRVDMEEVTAKWLNSFESKHTRVQYEISLRMYQDWLLDNDIHPLNVRAREADSYCDHVCGLNKSNATKNVRLAAMQSLYRYLTRWEYIDGNPYNGIKAPTVPKLKKQSDQVPSTDDIERLISQLELQIKVGRTDVARSSRSALATLHFMLTTGVRIGALDNLTINRKGEYVTKSKGKIVQGKLSPETLKTIRGLGTLDNLMNKINFHAAIRKWKREFNFQFSAHSLRHYFAVQHYRHHKDVIMLQRALGHASPGTTQVYLSSLTME